MAAEARRVRPLKRLRAGCYRTACGRFTIQRDPTGGENYSGWGYTSWLIHEDGEDEPLYDCGRCHFTTLHEAVAALEAREVQGG